MKLPYSDELNIGHLSRLFDNRSTCYKFFWFLSLLDKQDGKNYIFTYDELLNEMIAYAWYMVAEYNLRLGPTGVKDNLEDVVKYIQSTYEFPSTKKREELVAFLETTDDRKVSAYKGEIIKNVPYRLQTPFFNEYEITADDWKKSIDHISKKINTQKRLIYYFVEISKLNSTIKVDEQWATYLFKNKEILRSWTQLNLIKYLQDRNPGIPGIPDKIEKPTKRDLKDVGDYWKLIISRDGSIRDIYGRIELFDKKISIDHFVPWQYVAHDELWNLHPTTVSINSRKSNQLPDWDKYFYRLSDLEFTAYLLMKNDAVIEGSFNRLAKKHLNDSNIRSSLYDSGLDKPEFTSRLEKVIKPVFDLAINSGFTEWDYDKSISEI